MSAGTCNDSGKSQGLDSFVSCFSPEELAPFVALDREKYFTGGVQINLETGNHIY